MKEIKMYESFDGKCVGTMNEVKRYEADHIDAAFKSLYQAKIKLFPYGFDGTIACVTVVKCDTAYDYTILVEYAKSVNRETCDDNYNLYEGAGYYVLVEEECGWGDIIPLEAYRASFREFYDELNKF